MGRTFDKLARDAAGGMSRRQALRAAGAAAGAGFLALLNPAAAHADKGCPRNRLCNGVCCPKGSSCCGGICCPDRQGRCCPTDAGTICCPEGQSCCPTMAEGSSEIRYMCCPSGRCQPVGEAIVCIPNAA